MKTPFIILLPVFLVIASCAITSLESPVTSSDGTTYYNGVFEPGFGWSLVWSDEFESNAVDTNKWVFDIGTGVSGWGNNELEYYTSRTNNVRVENGNLIIQALQESYGGMSYTSARLKTQGIKAWTFGKIVARIKLPYGQGIWPAFWMLGDNFNGGNWPACGEIDILEMIGGDGDSNKTLYSTLHWLQYGTYAGFQMSTNIGEPLANNFHIYEIDWSSTTVVGKIDGKQFYYYDITSPNCDAFRLPFFILLNLAVGGNWPKSPDASTVFPQTMTVDWVRVYQQDFTLPSVNITYPQDSTTIYGNFPLMGTTSGSNDIANTFVSVDNGEFKVIGNPSNWSSNLNMAEGNHSIRVFALDVSNRTSATNNMNLTVTWIKPKVWFTNWPWGDYHARGNISGVSPSLYKISLWIYAWIYWYPKPYYGAPYTTIQNDGSWNGLYNTGGSDASAVNFIAYLIPSYVPTDQYGSASTYAVATTRLLTTDTVPPTNTITSPTNGQSVKGRMHTYNISGTVADNGGINEVYLSANGSPYIAASLSGVNWNSNLTLVDGVNTVSVYSVDWGYNTSSTDQVTFTYSNDDTAPVVTILTPANNQQVTAPFNLTGTSSDANSIAAVYLEIDDSGYFTPVGTTNWSVNGLTLVAGSHTLKAYAVDTLGNYSTTNSVGFTVQ